MLQLMQKDLHGINVWPSEAPKQTSDSILLFSYITNGIISDNVFLKLRNWGQFLTNGQKKVNKL